MGKLKPNKKLQRMQSIETKLEDIAVSTDITVEDILSAALRLVTSKESPLSKILQYSLDVAGDQLISEEFYQQYPDLTEFLALSGCSNEEILFRMWTTNHEKELVCGTDNCGGILLGGCPRVYCSKCGTKYFLEIDYITDLVCSRCVAGNIKECKSKDRIKLPKIFGEFP